MSRKEICGTRFSSDLRAAETPNWFPTEKHSLSTWDSTAFTGDPDITVSFHSWGYSAD